MIGNRIENMKIFVIRIECINIFETMAKIEEN